MAPNFWAFLDEKAQENLIASPQMVLTELLDGEDQLKEWAIQQVALFRAPDEAVEAFVTQIATAVTQNGQYAPQHTADFLSKADPWVIAHARALGGRIVTFEQRAPPASHKPKIPNVAAEFGITCITLWDLLTELGWST